MRPQTRAQIKELLERHGLRPRKALGQHFLADANITEKIVGLASVGEGDRVVEIGPGTGTLTAGLAAVGATVVAIEVDESLRPVLEETVGAVAELRFEDATKVDFSTVFPGEEWVLVANLPYNVGTPLILDLLRHEPRVRRMVVMVQLEVAERLAAGVGSAVYGLPSVVAGLHGSARLAFKVPPQVFVPPPNVGSAVVVIERGDPDPRAEAAIELAGRAFAGRRKMIRRSLAGIVSEEQLVGAAFDPTLRAENLTPGDYLRLAEVVGD